MSQFPETELFKTGYRKLHMLRYYDQFNVIMITHIHQLDKFFFPHLACNLSLSLDIVLYGQFIVFGKTFDFGEAY